MAKRLEPTTRSQWAERSSGFASTLRGQADALTGISRRIDADMARSERAIKVASAAQRTARSLLTRASTNGKDLTALFGKRGRR